MTSDIGYSAENGDCGAAAVIGRGRSIKGPGCALFDSLIGAAAGNDWGSRIDYRHFLTARAAVAAGIRSLPRSGCIESRAAMATDIGHRAENSNCSVAAVIGRGRSIKGPGCALFNSLIGAAAGNDWRSRIDYCHFLTARAAVAAGVRSLPRSGSIESCAAMTSDIGYSAENGNCGAAAVIGRGRSIKGPGCALFDSLIGAGAGNDWGSGIDYRHFLTARAAIAAGIRSLPGPGCIKGRAAMTSGVGHGAENGDCGAAAVIGRGWSIKGPGCALFNSLIGAAADNDWRSRIDYCHFLTARAAVAAGIRGLPRSGCIKGRAAMADGIGHGAENSNCGAAAVIGRGRSIKGPGCALFNSLIGAGAGNHWRSRIDYCPFLTA